MLRFINGGNYPPELNMAFDETLFTAANAALRVYGWARKCATIGYFQKNTCSAVRRLTGGLLVNHGLDISYSFTAAADAWQFVYNQNLTYKNIHLCIKNALHKQGIESFFAEAPSAAANNICVETVYDYDLMQGTKKIVGSCQRRRGRTILVQGSVHIKFTPAQKDVFAKNFAENMAQLMGAELSEKPFTEPEIFAAAELAKNKYSKAEWNCKV